MKKINVHIYPSQLIFESRIFKETQTLIKKGLVDEIYIVGIWRVGLARYEDLSPQIHIVRLNLCSSSLSIRMLARILGFIELYIRICLLSLRLNPWCINCHSLSVLPVGVLHKFFGCKLMYDAHELETERNGLRGVAKKLSVWVEAICIRFVDCAIFVSPSIQEWYQKRYSKIPCSTILNLPSEASITNQVSHNLREIFNLTDRDILFIYQGILSKGRGVEILLQVFSELPTTHHLVCMGYGPLTSLVQEYAARSSQIHLHPPVPMNDIISYTRSADIGIVLFEDNCLSHYYALPNKFFEYLTSGVPVVASNYPDMSRILEQHQVGWTVAPDERSLTTLISQITPKEIEDKKRNALQVGKQYTWESQEDLYRTIYEALDV